MRKINENIAYAKSILNKSGISPDSPEYQDYIKIRKICGEDNGYVGILTKLRFIDNVTDFEELASIFEILKKSKFDFAKLNKLSYQEILNSFYDKLSGEDKTDIELIHKDETYSYYRVYTYEGMLKIGSPAWCLKTKSQWENYNGKYPIQWVVVENSYLKKLITPNNYYLDKYSSPYGWIRYGISLKEEGDGWRYLAFSDNNDNISSKAIHSNYTFLGVMRTVFNLLGNNKKSFFDYMPGCEEKYKEDWNKITDKKIISEELGIKPNIISFDNKNQELYIRLSKEYNFEPSILSLDNTSPKMVFIGTETSTAYASLKNKIAIEIFENYALKSNDILYLGVKLKLGKITIEEIEKNKQFFKKIGKWIVFDRNDEYYLVVNSEMNEYQLYANNANGIFFWEMTDPVYWYINKKTKKIWALPEPIDAKKLKYTTEVMDELFRKVKRFWQFGKKK